MDQEMGSFIEESRSDILLKESGQRMGLLKLQ